MDFEKTTLGLDDDGRRYDRILRKFLPTMPLSDIYKNIRSGFIRLNGKKASAETKVSSGDELWIAAKLAQTHQIPPPKSATTKATLHQSTENAKNLIDAVFQNEHILIINKPYGIPVQQATQGEISLDALVKAQYEATKTAAHASVSFAPGPLHRLDRNTTGLVAFSQSLKGAQWFSEAIAAHIVHKEYLGIVAGRVPEAQTWRDTIAADSAPQRGFFTVTASPMQNAVKPQNVPHSREGTNRTPVANENHSATRSREAITHCTPLSYGSFKGQTITLCRFVIETGRKHQIRAQSAAHGFPLAGDSAYGSDLVLPLFSGVRREYFLHAERLIFPEQTPLALPQKLTAPLDGAFASFIAECGCENPQKVFNTL